MTAAGEVKPLGKALRAPGESRPEWMILRDLAAWQGEGRDFPHPGFPRRLWKYHTITDTWSSLGAIPESAANQVTTTAVPWRGAVVLPSGEVREFGGDDLDLVSDAEGITGLLLLLQALSLAVVVGSENLNATSGNANGSVGGGLTISSVGAANSVSAITTSIPATPANACARISRSPRWARASPRTGTPS